jgi:hypothetical protein
MEAASWSGNDLFEFITGRRIAKEARIDSRVEAGTIDPSEAEGWSMGDQNETLVLGLHHRGNPRDVFGPITPVSTRDMLYAIDGTYTGGNTRFSSIDLLEQEVAPSDAPPHIHNRKLNWTRWVRLAFDGNGVTNNCYVFVFYENWADGALYRGNLMGSDINAIATGLNMSKHEVLCAVGKLVGHMNPKDFVVSTLDTPFMPPDNDEVRSKKAERNRARRMRKKENRRERAEALREEEEQRMAERGSSTSEEGINLGRKGVQQLEQEAAEQRRKELAENHRQYMALHPKQERVAVVGESHKPRAKPQKREPTTEELMARMEFDGTRDERQEAYIKKQQDEHQAKLDRKAREKADQEKLQLKEAAKLIALASNPKAPPMTVARAVGL